MKAINPRNQGALDKFCQNEFWRCYYANAPAGAKALIEDGFTASLSEDESDDAVDTTEDALAVEDIRYFAERGYNQQMRKHYAEVLEKRIAADAQEEDAFIKRARDWYCQRRTWKARYKSASPCVKRYFDFTFAHGFGSIVPSEREAYAKITESIMQKLHTLYEMFTDAEWDEAIAISGCRQGLMRARVKYQKKSTKNVEVVNWDEEIGGVKNSPRYDPEEAAAVAANVKEAETMTWEELKRQSESCPP